MFWKLYEYTTRTTKRNLQWFNHNMKYYVDWKWTTLEGTKNIAYCNMTHIYKPRKYWHSWGLYCVNQLVISRNSPLRCLVTRQWKTVYAAVGMPYRISSAGSYASTRWVPCLFASLTCVILVPYHCQAFTSLRSACTNLSHRCSVWLASWSGYDLEGWLGVKTQLFVYLHDWQAVENPKPETISNLWTSQ